MQHRRNRKAPYVGWGLQGDEDAGHLAHRLALRSVAAYVAHEINHPLGMIANLASLLSRQINDPVIRPSELAAEIDSIKQETGCAADVIKNLRVLAGGLHGQRDAAIARLRGIFSDIDFDLDHIPDDVLDSLTVGMEDFQKAPAVVEPSTVREVFTEIPDVRWEDVGGLDDVKKLLEESIQRSLAFPDLFGKPISMRRARRHGRKAGGPSPIFGGSLKIGSDRLISIFRKRGFIRTGCPFADTSAISSKTWRRAAASITAFSWISWREERRWRGSKTRICF